MDGIDEVELQGHSMQGGPYTCRVIERYAAKNSATFPVPSCRLLMIYRSCNYGLHMLVGGCCRPELVEWPGIIVEFFFFISKFVDSRVDFVG